MDDAGTNVNLTVSSSHLILTALETGRVLANHSMPHISFASGGDTVCSQMNIFIIFLILIGNSQTDFRNGRFTRRNYH